jgi:hypothetical protein
VERRSHTKEPVSYVVIPSLIPNLTANGEPDHSPELADFGLVLRWDRCRHRRNLLDDRLVSEGGHVAEVTIL